jgi:hypothetical protein
MTTAAIAGGHLSGDDKSVVVLTFLIGRGLVTVETRYPLFSVATHLVFMDD